jgi:hypothetical protein
VPRVPRGRGQAQKKRKILQSRYVDVDNVHSVSLADLLLFGLTAGEGDAVSSMIDALRFEINVCARFNEEHDVALATLLDMWARRLRVIGEILGRQLAGRIE